MGPYPKRVTAAPSSERFRRRLARHRLAFGEQPLERAEIDGLHEVLVKPGSTRPLAVALLPVAGERDQMRRSCAGASLERGARNSRPSIPGSPMSTMATCGGTSSMSSIPEIP